MWRFKATHVLGRLIPAYDATSCNTSTSPNNHHKWINEETHDQVGICSSTLLDLDAETIAGLQSSLNSIQEVKR